MKKTTALPVALTLLFLITSLPGFGICQDIQWKSYENGIEQAEEQNKKILLYFHADWCSFCKKMDTSTFQDQTLVAYLTDNFIAIAVDSEKEKKIASAYRVRGLPTLWLLKEDSEKLSSLPGYVDADRLINILKYVKTESYTKMSFANFLDMI
ncbi:MAG: thioredoxin fold domain-containing protein [Desulfobacteraceae bacterium]